MVSKAEKEIVYTEVKWPENKKENSLAQFIND